MGNELNITLTMDDLEQRVFMPIDLGNEEAPFMLNRTKEEKKADVSNVEEVLRRTDSQHLSLLKVIDGLESDVFSQMAQPIFKIKTNQSQGKDTIEIENSWYAFIAIRSTAIEFQEQPATAIFLSNCTDHVKSMMLKLKIVEAQNLSENMESYTATVSHEFKTPLSTSLMFIENLLTTFMHQKQRFLCQLIQRQLYFLVSLVNDLIDLKVIE